MLAARAEFPLLEQCIYLNNNSMGATPRGVKPVLDAYWGKLASWRDEAFEAWWMELFAYADDIATLIGAPAGSVITDTNLATLFGRLLTCFDFADRPRVVTSDLEFPTAEFLFRAFARYGCELTVVRSRDGVAIDEEEIVRATDERTQLVFLSHAAFATGALLDPTPIVRRAREVGALVALDAYQSVGAVPIDVTALGVDFLLGGAHKWLCGSLESAFMYVCPRRIAELRPAATGWIAGADPFSFKPAAAYADDARRFSAGTPAVLPALASRVGMRILREIGMDAIRRASLRRTERICARAEEAGLSVVTPRAAARRAGIVCLRFPGDARAVEALKARGLVCSYRGGVRVAPHFYNTDEEVEVFMDALIALSREHAS
jgi:selenocysteine lyase/cysteine desulfurase